MSDTQRVGEIANLEHQLSNALRQTAEFKETAKKWEPIAASEVTNTEVKISLMFGGKAVSVKLPVQNFQGADVVSATTTILEAMFDSLISDALRPVVQPEVQRVVEAANSLKVSKW